ncbi:hypothetical protein B0H21DRAFT_741453 [Amylocystis lapponica]|nr:hypothetical protein B0H21DRAFT_741453 [Amylocystis lapponica]
MAIQGRLTCIVSCFRMIRAASSKFVHTDDIHLVASPRIMHCCINDRTLSSPGRQQHDKEHSVAIRHICAVTAEIYTRETIYFRVVSSGRA